MSIRIGSRTFTAINPGTDRDTEEALVVARILRDSGREFTSALVHRFDGLVLLEGEITSSTEGYHFRTPICGYEGTGPRTTAQILEMFGFGNETMTYRLLLQGGEEHTFTR